MEHFGAQRGSTVVFEDAIHAIETAKKDGFTVAAVFDESEKRQDEVRALADCYITSFEQLEQFWGNDRGGLKPRLWAADRGHHSLSHNKRDAF